MTTWRHLSETFKGNLISGCHLEQGIIVGANNRHTENISAGLDAHGVG